MSVLSVCLYIHTVYLAALAETCMKCFVESKLQKYVAYNSNFQEEYIQVESDDSVTHGVRHGPHCKCQLLPHGDLILVYSTEYQLEGEGEGGEGGDTEDQHP